MTTSKAAHEAVAFALDHPAIEPPPYLIEEEATFWRQIVADLPHGHIKSDNTPVLCELCRHLVYSRQVAEQLREMRETRLTTQGPTPSKNRSIFNQLLTAARDETRVIANLSVKLRLCSSPRDTGHVVEAERARTPSGRKPWTRADREEMPEPWKMPVREKDKHDGLRS
jgi:hypothetical protein